MRDQQPETTSMISVIIPVYNVEKYLRHCLESMVAQTYRELEIILVDDGSTDSSGLICDEYARQYDNITACHKDNGGLSDARNYGLARSSGEYVAFLDSDDWAEPEMYERLHGAMVTHDADIAVCNHYVHQDGKKSVNKHFDKREPLVLSSDEALESVLSNVYFSYMVNTKLYKRRIALETPFVKGLLFEDIVFTPSTLLKAKSVVYLPEPLFNYRIRKNSISHTLKQLYEATRVREIRNSIIIKERPELAPLAIQEYKSAFFGQTHAVSKDIRLFAQIRRMVPTFQVWCTVNDVILSAWEKRQLWRYSHIPLFGYVLGIKRRIKMLFSCLVV